MMNQIVNERPKREGAPLFGSSHPHSDDLRIPNTKSARPADEMTAPM